MGREGGKTIFNTRVFTRQYRGKRRERTAGEDHKKDLGVRPLGESDVELGKDGRRGKRGQPPSPNFGLPSEGTGEKKVSGKVPKKKNVQWWGMFGNKLYGRRGWEKTVSVVQKGEAFPGEFLFHLYDAGRKSKMRREKGGKSGSGKGRSTGM